MNTIRASEVKRRGVAALEEAVVNGPVHVIKNNRPTLVVLNERQYAELAAGTAHAAQSPRMGIWEYIVNRPHEGTRTKKEIKARIREERKSWGDR